MSLDSDFAAILLKLEMVSHGTVQAIGFSTGGESDNPWPSGCKGAEFLYFRGRWKAARTDADREKLIAEATDAWERLTGRSKEVKLLRFVAAGESREDRDQRIVRDGEGWTAKDAAIHFRCAVADVRRARLGAGREPALGLDVEKQPAERERVLELAERGLTERQIAMLTKLSKSTVRRALGKVA